MIYRIDKNGRRISQLGYGCMRFTKKGGAIDLDKAEKEVMYAIKNGVNYFDTAYIYPGSEEALGKILEKNNIRNKVYIATKLPHYLTRSMQAIEKTFNKQLERLKTDYIDYYLMHMFTDIHEWEVLKGLGIEKWIADKKESGQIKNIGFSYHGDSRMFIEVLNAYDWDFCQIQYNYLDENSQAGRKGLMAAAEKKIPVVIMEPLRGGKLVNMLPDSAKKIMAESDRDFTPAQWALGWLWDQPEVTCILSGMNSLEMVEENIRMAGEAGPGDFTEKDQEVIKNVIAAIRENEKVGCTGCGYCMPCPQKVDIPGNFYYYNLMYLERKNAARVEFAQNMSLRREPGFASQCVACGKCEKHCPQHIPIIEKLKEADKNLRPLHFKIGMEIARKFITRK